MAWVLDPAQGRVWRDEGPSMAGYTPGGEIDPGLWQQLAGMYQDPARFASLKETNGGSTDYYDPASGYAFVPKFQEIGGQQLFDGGTVYYGKNARDTKDKSVLNGQPGYVFDAQGQATGDPFQFQNLSKGNATRDFLTGATIMLGGMGATLAGAGAAAGGVGAAESVGGAGAAAGASGAAPSLTGLGMTGTVPAGMGYGSGLTTGLAGYGGLGAGAGYGATFGGAMDALGAAGVAGAASGASGVAGGLGGAGSALGGAAGNGAGGAATGGFNWGSLVGPAISAIGGAYSAGQAKDAAEIQAQSARDAQAKLEPWYQKGELALNALGTELGLGPNTGAANYGRSARDFGMADFQADPGYAFRQSEQQRALERAASAQGGIGSGKFLKDAMSYSGGLASQEFGNAFNRFQTARTNRLNPLQSLAGQGQSTAQMVGDLSTQAGNAQAAGKVGSANALTNAIGQGFSMYQNSQQNDQNNQLMNYLLRRG